MASDVLLVNPNRIRPPIAPLALEYLANALERAGIVYSVLDLCFTEDPYQALANAVLEEEPHLIAITFRNTDNCYCATQHSFIPDLQRLVQHIRALTNTPIVLGGSGFSVASKSILRRTGADLGVRGDGEKALVTLTQALIDNTTTYRSIPGLLWREGSVIHANPPTWASVAQRPLNRMVIDNERYFREGGQVGIETKRGCSKQCAYCADPLSKGTIVRTRPPASVASEMLSLVAQGIDVFHTCDSEFNSDLTHAFAVCKELIERDAREKLRWYAYCSPTPFPTELPRRMAEAGCVGINFGVDSGDRGMLRRLGREHTPDDIVSAVQACQANGVAVMLDLLLGAPGETWESVGATIDLVRRSAADCVGVALGVRVYAGTKIAAELVPRIEAGDYTGLRGQIEDNEEFAEPLFYLEPQLGEDPVGFLKDLIAGDQRFFFGWPDNSQADYNYDDNAELVAAIRNGARGAYWDILRKTRRL
ncbi:MAG: B12-binding domain-containing radical SAM protein [Candidatus Zipacnadales bacterium]